MEARTLTSANANPKRRVGQGLVEFALILPVMLLVIFVIIELARVLHAWLAVENGARFGIRYAITSEYNPFYCDGNTNNSCIDECDSNADGICTPDDSGYGLVQSARLRSIYDAAMAGSQTIMRDPTLADWSLPAYFEVTVCSLPNRAGVTEGTYYTPSQPGAPLGTDWTSACSRGPAGMGGNYPGDEGERVWVTVNFNHPLITPLVTSALPMMRLTARRDGIVETFRTVRFLGAGAFPTAIPFAPTNTFTPSPPPTSTNTPLPSATPTATYTATMTPTPTPTPDCSKIEIGSLTVTNGTSMDAYVRVSVTNNNRPGLTAWHNNAIYGGVGTYFNWPDPESAPNMYVDYLDHAGIQGSISNTRYFTTDTYTPPISGPYSDRGIAGGGTSQTWTAHFHNVPSAGVSGVFTVTLTYIFDNWPTICEKSASASLSLLPRPTNTPAPTATITRTVPSPTRTRTPAGTPTRTSTLAPTRTNTPGITPTRTPTVPVPTPTKTPTPTQSGPTPTRTLPHE